MCERAAQKRDVLHARQLDVADELAPTAHVAVILLAEEPCADALFRHAPYPAATDLYYP